MPPAESCARVNLAAVLLRSRFKSTRRNAETPRKGIAHRDGIPEIVLAPDCAPMVIRAPVLQRHLVFKDFARDLPREIGMPRSVAVE